jgi:two-component system response regulator FlrC
LQERIVTPLGSQTEVAVDVRVIATSNRNMFEQVQARTFREDLYYRLNVFPLETRALADRPDDIIPLTIALIRRHAEDKLAQPWLGNDAIDRLLAHDWPGNVRELENVVQRALVLRIGDKICAQDIVIDRPVQSRVETQIKHAQAWLVG